MEHPATYTDAGYKDDSISEHCKPLVSGLLKLSPAGRLDATEGSRRARAL